MNLLCSTYIFYADVYFVQNFIIKIAVIYLSLYCNKLFFLIDTAKGIGKVVFVSALGTLIEIMGLTVGSSYMFFVLLVNVFEIPLMLWFLLGSNRRYMIRTILMGYFFIMIINATLEIIWNWVGDRGYYVLYLIASCGVIYICTRVWLNYQRMNNGIFQVELEHGSKQITTYGFYDSGNRLKDPYTGKAVHIIVESLISQLLVDNQKEIYIPYQSLGKEDGLIRVYYVEYIRIWNYHVCIERRKVPIGVVEDMLLEKKNYQMILNEEL